MRLRSTIKSAGATALALGVVLGMGFGLPAAHAAAGSSHGAAVTMRLAGPDNQGDCQLGPQPDVAVHVFNGINEGGDEWSCACHIDTVYTNILDPIESVENGCDYRFYLQDDPKPGEAFCISGGTIRNDIGVEYRDPPSVKVGASEQPC